MISLAALGTFLGSFLVTARERMHGGDKPKIDAMQLERLGRIENKLEEAVYSISTLSNENSDIRAQISDVKRSISRLERENVRVVDSRVEEMHTEEMAILRELHKNWINKK